MMVVRATLGVSLMLSVRYSPDVPPALIDLLEHHAREEGLSLGALEVIGASLDFVEAFIVAAEDGKARTLLAAWGLIPPTADVVDVARFQAEKIFGAR